jgi:hypothetical protein
MSHYQNTYGLNVNFRGRFRNVAFKSLVILLTQVDSNISGYTSASTHFYVKVKAKLCHEDV